LGVLFSIAGCAASLADTRVAPAPPPPSVPAAAPAVDLWPEPFPPVGRRSLRPELTENIRKNVSTLGLNGLKGLDGDTVSRAVALFKKDRAAAGVITFEIEAGPEKGVHQCEALGRGVTSFSARPGWTPGTIREPGGRETAVYYAPKDETGGATIPGIYNLRNIRPSEYEIKLLNRDLSGEEELVKRLSSADPDSKPYYSGVWKHWYPRTAGYAAIAPLDMIWSVKYQGLSQSAGTPVFERPGVKKDPKQVRRDPAYYTGPYGRYGMAAHTDRWDDEPADPQTSEKNEFRSFLFRDTNGCLKLHPDCLRLLNVFTDEQAAKGRVVQLEVMEIN